MDQAITQLRERINEEFRIAERFDSKGRQAFALSAGFFALIQTVAFAGVSDGDFGSGARVLVVASALLAGVALLNVAHKLRDSEDLVEELDIHPDEIVAWVEEDKDGMQIRLKLVRELAETAKARSASNRGRATRFDAVASATRLSLILSAVELALAFILRI